MGDVSARMALALPRGILQRSSLAILLFAAAACGGKSSTSPSASGSVVQGQTLNVVTGTPSPGLTIYIGASRHATTDAQGMFSFDVDDPGPYSVTVRGTGVVDREMRLRATADRARLPLIPTSFDLTAFDEMFRNVNSRLQRWVMQPSLVVLATTMTFRSTGDDEFTAASEQMSDDEVALMVAHMSEGLGLLTGNTYTSFASVEVERPKSGDRVSVIRPGRVVVGRYTGIVTLASTIGYGRWSETSTGAVVSGAMFLDRDFDRSDTRRRLLRIHELGHALGYQHVQSRTSIMNPAIGPEPTDFDRTGAIIAFQRPPGNRSPDRDPSDAVAASAPADAVGGYSSPGVVCHITVR
jgi:matrixin